MSKLIWRAWCSSQLRQKLQDARWPIVCWWYSYLKCCDKKACSIEQNSPISLADVLSSQFRGEEFDFTMKKSIILISKQAVPEWCRGVPCTFSTHSVFSRTFSTLTVVSFHAYHGLFVLSSSFYSTIKIDRTWVRKSLLLSCSLENTTPHQTEFVYGSG